MYRRRGLLTLCCPLIFGCAPSDSTPPFLEGEWVDLTHELSSESLFWPTAEPFRLDTVAVGVTDQGFYYEAFSFSGEEHGGTHLDAPVHFAEGRHRTHEIPLDRLVGPAAVVDVSDAAALDRDYQVSVDDLRAWEEAHGSLLDDRILLIHTGFSRYWPDAEAYLGTSLRGPEGAARLSFPGIHPEAARWLVENRSIRAVGLDTPSLDHGPSVFFETHRILFEDNIPGFENVADLGRLPSTGAYVVALPVKIRGGSGGPLRIVAWIPSEVRFEDDL